MEEARSIIAATQGCRCFIAVVNSDALQTFGGSGEDLNGDIANLVKKGLNAVVAKSLDVVRVIGNESVHPGSIDLQPVAKRLFDLINIITEQMITQPKHVEELYSKLPESKRTAIEVRNIKALADPEK